MPGLLFLWNQPEQFPPSGGNQNHFCQNHFAQNHFAPYHFRPIKVVPPEPEDGGNGGVGSLRPPLFIRPRVDQRLCEPICEAQSSSISYILPSSKLCVSITSEESRPSSSIAPCNKLIIPVRSVEEGPLCEAVPSRRVCHSVRSECTSPLDDVRPSEILIDQRDSELSEIATLLLADDSIASQFDRKALMALSVCNREPKRTIRPATEINLAF